MLTATADITCPHCGETFSTTVDPSEGRIQSWIIDCEICCRPMEVTIRRGKKLRIDVQPAQ